MFWNKKIQQLERQITILDIELSKLHKFKVFYSIYDDELRYQQKFFFDKQSAIDFSKIISSNYKSYLVQQPIVIDIKRNRQVLIK